jgi:hypothetical protein
MIAALEPRIDNGRKYFSLRAGNIEYEIPLKSSIINQ